MRPRAHAQRSESGWPCSSTAPGTGWISEVPPSVLSYVWRETKRALGGTVKAEARPEWGSDTKPSPRPYFHEGEAIYESRYQSPWKALPCLLSLGRTQSLLLQQMEILVAFLSNSVQDTEKLRGMSSGPPVAGYRPTMKERRGFCAQQEEFGKATHL